ncbi:delta-1-pyrroline-5-carboxylate dehydrogenase, mitochondrial-like [Orbicella faveolata]|uniref:delta-1-pyrroline-5-carboxylate dehydrogenase, mitochondrial-like n=1 Tax=Orbicella faveolata TaxID=48498 RepID=UPI0009E2EA57|nr:delta-1-pyrroline-5-carboxylate dehydrogenase, mitochondrial-like [Orbicella faveolata]
MLAARAVFRSQALRILGTRSIALPPNEPPTNLDRNSVDLKELKAEIERVQNETVEIPCIVGGKEIYTGNTRYQVAVSQML